MKILVASAAVVVVASAALLAPGLASGQTFVPIVAPVTLAPHDAPGTSGQGKAWGHHRDSPDFPGSNGRGHDRGETEDATGAPGQGEAWGHHKDSPDFPGGKGWGHRKDSEGFPGDNGRGRGKDD